MFVVITPVLLSMRNDSQLLVFSSIKLSCALLNESESFAFITQCNNNTWRHTFFNFKFIHKEAVLSSGRSIFTLQILQELPLQLDIQEMKKRAREESTAVKTIYGVDELIEYFTNTWKNCNFPPVG